MPDEVTAAQNLDGDEATQDNPEGFGPIEKSTFSVGC